MENVSLREQVVRSELEAQAGKRLLHAEDFPPTEDH